MKFLAVLVLLAAIPALTQTPTAKPTAPNAATQSAKPTPPPQATTTPPVVAAPAPQLSTADQVALTGLENKKSDAQKAFQDANLVELQILREWMDTHPGWVVNQATFKIEPAPAPKGKP